MERKQRLIFYIDGFNFYFGLREKKWKKFYWLDLVKFSSNFLRKHQELIEVKYFSAIPKDSGKQDRQDLFFTANKINKKFKLILGKYLEKNVEFGGNKYKTFEEKQTDVNIAVNLIRDVIYDKCDLSILISADSDLTPAFEFIREYKPNHKLLVYFPPLRFSYELKTICNSYLKLENYNHIFEHSLLPDEIKIESGYIIKKPLKWK
ncbi:MAG: NYN domain-containing protein [Ignavibacteria bacterium GWB2_35_12]|nr:MAG: NYN domain-containing protein [Ignavibacteria bacterium GWA2_35_8]OGU42036.1 MAG: NYN domain-containing protein [Ignavibacteria bacterium GWB2_35_12]OGU93244.1 MAG: NYN domain-containing protein [Ignavibacteria bacterium RIFOXYA2_FULL_35_10]OGV18723.1 MAG: NYN domain-containing protein [Ignavibacteria bacterium RIFOXYC2_FULL_35_21]